MTKIRQIVDIFSSGKKLLFVLVDPDKFDQDEFDNSNVAETISGADMILVGGSLLLGSEVNSVIKFLKERTNLPVVLFPGGVSQLSEKVDAVMFLSLLSGRNPEYLIGQQVQAAPFIFKHQIECIPTAYVLIDGGKVSSTQYVSNTTPIPSDKSDIALATALAAKYLGFKLLYFEAGSGAKHCVPFEMIQKVTQTVDLPLIVGGGVKDLASAEEIYNSGATAIVVGTAFEKNPNFIKQIVELKNKINTNEKI